MPITVFQCDVINGNLAYRVTQPNCTVGAMSPMLTMLPLLDIFPCHPQYIIYWADPIRYVNYRGKWPCREGGIVAEKVALWLVGPHVSHSLSYRCTGIYFTMFIWHFIIIYRAGPKYLWGYYQFHIYSLAIYSCLANISVGKMEPFLSVKMNQVVNASRWAKLLLKSTREYMKNKIVILSWKC